jgi:photosystem II stability/assembly factor-like uncharacterized protein
MQSQESISILTYPPSAWTKLLDAAGGTVVDLKKIAHPDGSEQIFAATLVGVFHSTDGGNTWVLFGDASVPPMVQTLVISSDAENRPLLFAGSSVGLFYTAVDQPNWQALLAGVSVLAISVAPSDPLSQPIVIATEELDCLRSEGGGHEWHDANAGLDGAGVVAMLHSHRYADDRTLFLATTESVYRSRNGGRAWKELEAPFQGIRSLDELVGPAGTPVLVAVTEDGEIWLSTDAGKTWSLVMSGPDLDQLIVTGPSSFAVGSGNSLMALDLHDEQPTVISDDLPKDLNCLLPIAGGWLAGGEEWGITRSRNGQAGWESVNQGLAALIRGSLTIASGEESALAVLEAGSTVRVSRDGGNTWESIAGPDFDELQSVELYSSTPETLGILVTGWDGVYASTDGGARWEPVLESPEDADVIASHRFGDGELLAVLSDGRVIGSAGAQRQTLGVSGDISVATMIAGNGDSAALWVLAVAMSEQGETEVSIWYTADRGAAWERWLSAPPQAVMAIESAVDSDGRDLLIVGALNQLAQVQLIDGELQTRQLDLGDDLALVTLAASPNYARDSTIYVSTSAGLMRVDTRTGAVQPDASNAPHPILDLVASGAGESAALYAIERGGAIWKRALRQ